MGNHEFQRGEIFEQVGGQELHERGCVSVQIMRTRRVEGGVARGGYVDHRRDFELHTFFAERITTAVGESRFLPVAARWIGIQIAADEPQLIDATLEFWNAVAWRNAWRLRQLPDANEILGIQIADAMDHV